MYFEETSRTVIDIMTVSDVGDNIQNYYSGECFD